MMPISSAIEFFFGISTNMSTCSGISCPSSISHSLLRAKPFNTAPMFFLFFPKTAFFRYFWYSNHMIFAIPCGFVLVLLLRH